MCLGSRWHRSKIKTSHCAIGLPSSDICFSMIPCFTNSAPSKSWKYINMWISEFIALQTVSCGPCGPKSSGRMNWSQVVKQWASERESVKKTKCINYRGGGHPRGPPVHCTEGRPGSGSTSSKTKCFPAACLFCACRRSRKSRSYCWEDLPLDVLSLSSQMWAGSVVPGRCLLRKFPSCLAIRSLTVKCMYIV